MEKEGGWDGEARVGFGLQWEPGIASWKDRPGGERFLDDQCERLVSMRETENIISGWEQGVAKLRALGYQYAQASYVH